MITLVLIQNKNLRDTLISLSSSMKQVHSNEKIAFYQKWNVIFAFSEELSLLDLYNFSNAEYKPDKIFMVDLGRSIDTEHEIWDIILPNTFLDFNAKILEQEINESNRDDFLWNAKFLEIFDEHKDYYVENYGLSIWGIAVANTPNNEEISEVLMKVYSADIYTNYTLDSFYEIVTQSEIPAILLLGVIDWKSPKNIQKTPILSVAENLLTTIRLLNDEEN